MKADISNKEQLNLGLNEMKSFIYKIIANKHEEGGKMIASQGKKKKKEKE